MTLQANSTFITDSEHYDMLLSRYRTGSPELPGPSFLHPMFIGQRKRELQRKRDDAARRERQWKDPKPVTCRGPSTFRIMLAALFSYAFVFTFCGAVILFILHYSGILKIIIWLYHGFVWLFARLVSFFPICIS
jgi:hypothetical protein